MLPTLAGCGGKGGGVATVVGAVRQGGKPVEGGTGTVTFVSSTGLRASGQNPGSQPEGVIFQEVMPQRVSFVR